MRTTTLRIKVFQTGLQTSPEVLKGAGRKLPRSPPQLSICERTDVTEAKTSTKEAVRKIRGTVAIEEIGERMNNVEEKSEKLVVIAKAHVFMFC